MTGILTSAMTSLLLVLLLTSGGGQLTGVEGGMLTTPFCVMTCVIGPCAAAAAICKYMK
jgi:hypothetical protein